MLQYSTLLFDHSILFIKPLLHLNLYLFKSLRQEGKGYQAQHGIIILTVRLTSIDLWYIYSA